MDTTKIWIVLHYRIGANEDESDNDETVVHEKVVGLYSTEGKASDAIDRMKSKPGFRNWPDGFRMGCQPLDITFWNDGFTDFDEEAQGV